MLGVSKGGKPPLPGRRDNQFTLVNLVSLHVLAMSISDPLYWLGYHTNFWLSSHEIDAVLYLSW